MSWHDILVRSRKGHHIVQTYTTESALIESVTLYAASGFQEEQGVLVVATKSHLKAFSDRLLREGHDIERARMRHQFVELAAEEVLARAMVNGMPDARAFTQLAQTAIQKTRGNEGRGIRIFGELVNVLWQAGNLKGAMAIESLWDRLGKSYPFTLFCGYSMNSFDRRICSGPLQRICDAHSHLIPAENYERLEDAVTKGSHDILGKPLTVMVRDLASSQSSSADMPVAQKMLLWLSENMPVIAEKILSRTQRYYTSAVETL